MAPEFAPSVVIYDLLRVADRLRGTVQYVERPPTMRVRVRWLEETVPDGYVPVGDGVAYVRETEDLLITKPEAAAIPKTLDGSRYLLAESPRPEDLWRMLIIVFPPAHTVVAPKPLPRGAKDFKGRLALFWVLRGDEEGREEIEWRMEKVEGNPLEQFQHRIRADAAGGPKPQPGTVSESNLSVLTDERPLLFLSYSQEDQLEKTELLTHLKVLELAGGTVDIWSDDLIKPGASWQAEITSAIERSKAAVLLITKNFLASEFIQSSEVPSLLQRREQLGLKVFPIIARPCAWRTVPWLAAMELRPKGGTPVFDSKNPDELLAKIVEEIRGAL